MRSQTEAELQILAPWVAELARLIIIDGGLGLNPDCVPALPAGEPVSQLTEDALRVLRTSRYTQHARECPDAAPCGSATSGACS
jgi:hypothetical protein